MISQQIRAIAPEQDPLRMGMGWTVDDLSKPQIMVESTFGDSHPGSAHLLELVEQAVCGVKEHGGKAARYFTTDICDGMAQGHDGINYSLASRDTITFESIIPASIHPTNNNRAAENIPAARVFMPFRHTPKNNLAKSLSKSSFFAIIIIDHSDWS